MADTTISIRTAGNKLLQLINLQRREVSRIYIFAALTGLIQLSLPLGIQAIVGLLFGGIISASLVVLIGFVVAGVFLAGVFQLLQMRVTEGIQQSIFTRLTFAYSYRIPKLDLLSIDNYYLPELVNRFFDTPTLQKGLSKLLLDFPAATIQILFGLILLSFYHPVFIAFGLLLILIVYLLFYFSSPGGFRTSWEESDYKYKVAHWLEEISRAIKTFKYAGTNLHLQKTDQLTAGYLGARDQHFRILLLQYKVLIGFKVFITAAMLVIGSLLLVQQEINLGQFIAAEIVIIAIVNAVEKLVISLETVYDILTSIEKLDKVLQKPHEKERKAEQGLSEILSKPLKVDVRDLTFSYTQGLPVFSKLSVQIEPGEKICIKGGEGSGKTTLLRILAGLYHDFEGQILVNDFPIQNIPPTDWRKKIAVYFTHEELFEASLIENLTLGKENIPLSEIAEICELVGLRDYINKHQDGYFLKIQPTGHKLSNSIVSKILIARCLLSKPSLLLLESGWQGIEHQYRKNIIDKLLEDKSFSVIMISDDEELSARFDKSLSIN